MPDLPPGMDPSVREPLGPRTPAAQDLAYERFARAGLRSDGYRFVVPGIRHGGVSDLPELAGAPSLRAALGTDAALATFTAIQNDLVGGFLDRHVRGGVSDFPARALAAHPEVIVQDLGWLRERAQAEASLGDLASRAAARGEGSFDESIHSGPTSPRATIAPGERSNPDVKFAGAAVPRGKAAPGARSTGP
jgi:hypothetical protein